MRSLTVTRLARATTCLLLSASVGACSIFTKQDREYLNARSAPPLKIPAGLSAPPPNPETRIPSVQGRAKAGPDAGLDVPPELALESNDIAVVRDGSLRWLLVQSSQDDLWQRLQEFWSARRINLAYSNSKYYVMETAWTAPGGAVSASAQEKVKYRVRLVQFPDEDGTEVYLTTYAQRPAPDGGRGAPPVQAADAAIGNSMLKRLIVDLGGPGVNTARLKAPAAPPKIGELVDDKGQGLFLKVDRAPEMAWRHVAQALDRLGYVVIGQTREKKYDLSRAPGAGGKSDKAKTAKLGGTEMGKGKRGPSSTHRDKDKNSYDYDQYGHQYLVLTNLPKKAPKKDADNGGGKGWFSWLFFSHPDVKPIAPDFTLSLAPTDRSDSRLTVGPDPSAGAKTEKDRKILKDIYGSLN